MIQVRIRIKRLLAGLLAGVMCVVSLFLSDALPTSNELDMQVYAASNEATIYAFLINNLGLNTAAACGVLANINAESGFDPTAYNANDSNGKESYGICQWNGSRFTSLKNWCSSNGYTYSTLTGQLYYLQYELNNVSPYTTVYNAMKKYSNTATDAYNAGLYWASNFEVCAVSLRESRALSARDTYWPKYAGTSLSGSGYSDPYDVEQYLFDAVFYANRYSDLMDAFGYDETALYNHWITYGIAEGRAASPYFDPIYYVNNNSDLLAAFGTDYCAVYQHFLTYGCNETNRKLTAAYDAAYYSSLYSDLSSFSGVDLFRHFATCGANEGRRASENFNPTFYRAYYSDLDAAYGDEMAYYYWHYLSYGINEGRIGADDVAPTISNITITDVSVSGYTVTCTVADSTGVRLVQFPTWTDTNGQDDIIWGIGTDNGDGTYSYRVNVSDHNGEMGTYYTHIYASDTTNTAGTQAPSTVIESNNPVISNVTITNITSSGYTVTCKATDDTAISSVSFPTWTANEGQDDIIWGAGTDNGDGTYSYKVKVSEHNNETGVYYTHIYAYDQCGNGYGYPCEAIYLSLEAPTVTVEAKSTSSIKVSWDAIDGATCYRIDRRQYGADAYETIATVTSSTTYTDTGLSAGTGYYYRVYAVNDGVISEKQSGVGTYTLEATTTTEAVTTTTTTSITTTTTTTTTTTAVIVTTSSTNSTTTTTKSTEATTTTSTEINLLIGDVNLDGDVRLEDSVILNKYVAGLVNLSDLAYSNADTNADDYVDADDALVLLKFQVGLVSSLPYKN